MPSLKKKTIKKNHMAPPFKNDESTGVTVKQTGYDVIRFWSKTTQVSVRKKKQINTSEFLKDPSGGKEEAPRGLTFLFLKVLVCVTLDR